MNDTCNGGSSRPADATPDYAEMADRLQAIASELLEEGWAKGAEDVIEKAKRLLSLASEIRRDHTS